MNPTHAPTPDLLAPVAAGDEEPVLALLRAGIPLSLLLDLAAGDLHSHEIYEHEGVDSDAFAHLQ